MNVASNMYVFEINESNDYQIRLSSIESQLPDFVMQYFMKIKSSLENHEIICFKRLIFLCDILIDYSWEMMNTNIWLFIDNKWRFIYGYAVLYKIFLLKKKSENQIEIIKLCDMGLLMTKPFFNNDFNQIIQFYKTDSSSEHVKEKLGNLIDRKNNIHITLNDKFKLSTETSPSIESFSENYKEKKVPVIIQKTMDHWPAMKGPNKWRFAIFLKTSEIFI